MARVLLIEASPFDPATGTVVPVRIAGGGSRAYTHRGHQDWLAGLVTEPLFTSLIGFDENGWTEGALPQTGAVAIAPARAETLTMLAGLVWSGATIEMRSGDDAAADPAWSVEIKGTVAGLTIKSGVVTLTISDFSGDLAKPVVPDTFAGDGGLEGGSDAVGRVKRRSWGRVWNVEGRLLDKANNIYEFGDPSRPLQAFDAVKDRGREGGLTTVAWAGSATATLTALQAADAPEGGAAVAPSIACAKWWTQPAGPLTADLRGETAGGYVETVAEIASRIAAAHSTITIDGLAAATAARPDPAGLHCDSATETAGQALDRLLLGASMIWAMQPEGTMALYPVSFDDPVETVAIIDVAREAAYPPVTSIKLGYARNQRKQTDGEISAAVLAGDVEGLGPLATAGEVDWSSQVGGDGKPEDNATVGATVGDADNPGNLGKPGGGTYTDTDIDTSKGTSADTAHVGGRTTAEVLGDIDAAKTDISGLDASLAATNDDVADARADITQARSDLAAEVDRATAEEGALQTSITSLEQTASANTAAITDEATTRATADSALADRTTTLESDYTDQAVRIGAVNASAAAAMPSDFPAAAQMWTPSIDGSPSTRPPLTDPAYAAIIATTANSVKLTRSTTGYQQIGPIAVTPKGATAKTIRITWAARRSVAPTSGDFTAGLQLRCLDASYAFVTNANGPMHTVTDAVQTFVDTITISAAQQADTSWSSIRVQFNYGAPYFNQAGGEIELFSIEVEDITDITANTAAITDEATTRATADSALADRTTTLETTVGSQGDDITANTAAITDEATTRATADSALATSITTLSASAPATGYLNNANFAAWSGALPDGFSPWVSGYTITGKGGGGLYGSGNTLSMDGGDGTNSVGIVQTRAIGQYSQPFKAGQWVVIEVDARYYSGDLRGAGVIFQVGTASYMTAILDLYADPDTSGYAGSGDGHTRRSWRKLVQMTGSFNSANTVINKIIANSSGSIPSRTSDAGARHIDWYYVNVRAATDQEIAAKQATHDIAALSATVSTQSSAITDLQNNKAAASTVTALQATVGDNTASITQQAGAIATVEESTAYFEEIVAASGSNPAIFQMLAGKNGSAMVLGGDRVVIVNTVNGEAVTAVSFEGGQAVLNDALLRRARVAPRSDSDVYLEVQLKPLTFLAGDGDVVQYQGGASFGATPERITVDASSLPALESGEAYDVRATSITDTQFTAKITKSTPGGATIVNTAAGTNAGGTPQWRCAKAGDDAYNDLYSFSFTATIPFITKVNVGLDNDPVWKYQYRGSVTLYGYIGGAWAALGTATVARSYSGNQGSSVSTSATQTINSGAAFGSGSAVFGVHPGDANTSVTAFAGVSYSTRTQGSETSVPGQLLFTVYPPPSDS